MLNGPHVDAELASIEAEAGVFHGNALNSKGGFVQEHCDLVSFDGSAASERDWYANIADAGNTESSLSVVPLHVQSG